MYLVYRPFFGVIFDTSNDTILGLGIMWHENTLIEFNIDTDGDAHLCPYCVGKTKNTLEYPPEELILSMKDSACHVFEKSAL